MTPEHPVHDPWRLAVDLWISMRPRQWSKNLFVFVGMLFTATWMLLPRAIGAFVIYSLLSSAVYLLNDVRDRDRDVLHPEKRLRPIAAGRVPAGAAILCAAACLVAGLAATSLYGREFRVAAAAFVLLQAAYTIVLKRIVLLDVFAIAGAFVLRAMAGGYAVGVPNSVWLLVCTLQLALFLGFGKRRHELASLEEQAGNHRETLEEYSIPFLDQMISIVLGGLTVSYAVYSVISPTAVEHPTLALTLPFVMYGIFRYLYLIHIRHMGGSPETILFRDRPLQLALGGWLAVVVLALRSSA